MAISAAMVKALREKTGLPMMECKKALGEANGDMDQAVELLRKKGMAQLGKRAGRATGQGRLTCHAEGGRVALVEMLCETEPVAGTEDFLKLGDMAAKVAVKLDSPTPETLLDQPMPDDASRKISDFLHDVVNRIRENIKVGRVGVVHGHAASYVHHDGRKGVVVEFNGECPAEMANDVCMHVAAMRPMHTRREEVDAALVESERQVAREQVQGKPENIVEKIVDGKINKWYGEIVLLEQPFVKDDKQSVGQVLKTHAPNLTINRFLRFEVGEA